MTATGHNNAAGIGGGGNGSGIVDISGGTVTATGGTNAPGIGGGWNSADNTVNISNTSIYSGTTADPANLLESYAGQSPVHITYGNTNNTTEDLPDADGNTGTVGAGAEGGTPIIAMIDESAAQLISQAMGGKPVIYADVSLVGGGAITGVGFNVGNNTISTVSGGAQIVDYVIAHEISAGRIERLPVNTIVQGDRTIFLTRKKPSGNSPFVLVMRVSDPPPKTGDNSTPIVWLALCLVCGAGAAVMLTHRRRKA